MTTNWNTLRDQAYSTACEHGFHDKEHSIDHFLMLVITELSEAVEADRKGKYANKEQFIRYENSTTYKHCFETFIKDSLEDELADAAIRLLDIAGLNNINLNMFCLQHVVTANKSFTENIYAIVKYMANYEYSHEEQINYALQQIQRLSEILNIDLLWHIQKKMEYNKERERLHGKGY